MGGKKTALAVGLKVDVDALPHALQERIRRGLVNLDDPATTLALLQMNAVVGVTGFFDDTSTRPRLKSVGIQCALCHSTVDASFAPTTSLRSAACGPTPEAASTTMAASPPCTTWWSTMTRPSASALPKQRSAI